MSFNKCFYLKFYEKCGSIETSGLVSGLASTPPNYPHHTKLQCLHYFFVLNIFYLPQLGYSYRNYLRPLSWGVSTVHTCINDTDFHKLEVQTSPTWRQCHHQRRMTVLTSTTTLSSLRRYLPTNIGYHEYDIVKMYNLCHRCRDMIKMDWHWIDIDIDSLMPRRATAFVQRIWLVTNLTLTM